MRQCPTCGRDVMDGLMCPVCFAPRLVPTFQPIAPQGWVCPKCGNVYAPNVPTCFKCNAPAVPQGPTCNDSCPERSHMSHDLDALTATLTASGHKDDAVAAEMIDFLMREYAYTTEPLDEYAIELQRLLLNWVASWSKR